MSRNNLELLFWKLQDVPEEFHKEIAWYLLGSLSYDTDSDEWEEEVENAIRHVRGIAGS